MKETESTFLDLINRHKAIIHKISKMYTDDAEEQRDLFQEIVLQLWTQALWATANSRPGCTGFL